MSLHELVVRMVSAIPSLFYVRDVANYFLLTDLELKEASFAAEIMTVIEHGRRNQLCIVRFTQERGAASTFNKVIDTIDDIFLARGLLIVDKYKTKMMIKTLNS